MPVTAVDMLPVNNSELYSSRPGIFRAGHDDVKECFSWPLLLVIGARKIRSKVCQVFNVIREFSSIRSPA